MRRGETKRLRCTIYTRVSTEHRLEQDFNSLHNQREASVAYIKSQAHEGWSLIRTAYDDGGFSGASMDRPALQRLLADVQAGLVDVVVVYKVDRLTRSLADFAKLVELFDRHQVSFVSVTQAFNTTTSMGRLTLNVLLSFAQFEREVTSERIRDKIAASKRKGLWVGGMVPLGYESRDRKIVVVEEEAERVRLIFQRYRDLGSLDKLLRELRQGGVVTKVRRLANGRTIGGIAFTRGPLAYLLRNRFYVGEVVYRGEVCPGEHAPILDRTLFEAVQETLATRRPSFFSKRAGSAALLIGKLYDERGHRMTPSHARKAGRRYRYYVSSALSQGRPEAAGSVARVAAETIEALVVRALRERFPERVEADDRALVLDCLARAVIRDRVVEITLTQHDQKAIERDATEESLEQRERSLAPTVVRVDWAPRPKRRRREIILPAQGDLRDHRPIRAETRATLVRAIARGRRWLDEITTGRASGPAEIAARESCTVRQVTRTISLAFLAPDLVKAAVDGRLPRGIGLIRLADPPLIWCRQRELLGVAPAKSAQPDSL